MDMTSSSGAGLTSQPGHFIGGEWTHGSGDGLLAVENPATGETIGEIAAGSAEDVDAAVHAAVQAMSTAGRDRWLPVQRQDALLALAHAVEAHADELAELERIDAGKPISNARRIDIPAAASILRYFAGWATKLTGETMELSQPGNTRGHTIREPVGVVGQIIPWNYPLMGAAFKIGPAIAAGCALVLKPAEQTSLSTLRLARLVNDCGFPPGFINVVTGNGEEAGAALVKHPMIAKISFTGSTETGRWIASACGAQMKRATLELGGKSPVIVMPDADLEKAASAIGMSIFFNSGQTCTAASRLFVHKDVAEALLEKIGAFAAALKIGPTEEPETQIGPTISARQRERVLAYIDGALGEGATAITGGRAVPGSGYYVQPTVLDGVQPGMRAVEEEIFGPVLCAMRFDTSDLDEIAAMANQSEYGLAAYAWTRDLRVANGLIDRLRVGTIRINSCGGADLSMPSGGAKQSGFGRENGRAGVEAYTELKSVSMVY